MKDLSIPLVMFIMVIVIFYYSTPNSRKKEDRINDCKMLREMIFTGEVTKIKNRGKGAFSKITIKGKHNLKNSFFFVKLEDEIVIVDIPPSFARENIDIGTTVSKLKGNYYFFFKKKNKLKADSVSIYANQQTSNPCDELLK